MQPPEHLRQMPGRRLAERLRLLAPDAADDVVADGEALRDGLDACAILAGVDRAAQDGGPALAVRAVLARGEGRQVELAAPVSFVRVFARVILVVMVRRGCRAKPGTCQHLRCQQ